MTHIVKDSFYKERFYQVTMSSLADEDMKSQEKRKLKEISKNVMPPEIINDSLGNFGKTSNGPQYHYLSFICIDRGIYSIAGIEDFIHLQYIDISHNHIMTLKPLSPLKYLTYLNCSHNKIRKLLDFKDVPYTLEEIDFSYNEIEVIPDLSKHRFLNKVNLNNNAIKVIDGFSKNKNLQVLRLANNQIENIENLDNLNLIELDLKGNQIKVLAGLAKLPMLRMLNLSSNQIRKLIGLVDLISLRELRLSNNNIEHIRELFYIENLAYLSVLDLCFNKVQSRRYYRYQVIYKLPGLRLLDGVPTTSDEFVKSENLYGMDLEDRRRIFKEILPDEEFIDRRINIAELIEYETESENEEDIQFIDKYNKEGELIRTTSQLNTRRASMGGKSDKMHYTNKSSSSQKQIGGRSASMENTQKSIRGKKNSNGSKKQLDQQSILQGGQENQNQINGSTGNLSSSLPAIKDKI